MSDSKEYDVKYEENFMETKYTDNIAQRAIWYLNSGFPIHLRGPAGVGKTSIAFHISKKIGRPVIFMCGSEEFSESDMMGGFSGISRSLVVDNYISSVYKREEQEKRLWKDGKLVAACKYGYTLIYDEFTRVRPEVNNVLLSALEEKVLSMPVGDSKNSYIKIHPEFKMIFTSNPEEYVGVYKSANALMDRMITIDMNSVDEETEKIIVISKSGLSSEEAEKIVRISRYIRNSSHESRLASIRCSIMLATIVSVQKVKLQQKSDELRQMCMDIYGSPLMVAGLSDEKKEKLLSIVDRAINNVFYGKSSNM